MNARNRVVWALLVLGAALAAGAWWFGASWWPHPDLRAGQDALAARAYRAAIRHYRKYLEQRPEALEVRLLAARTARRLGELEIAAALLHPTSPRLEPVPDLELERRLLRVQQGDATEAAAFLKESAPPTQAVREALIEGAITRLVAGMWRERDGVGELGKADLARAHTLVDEWLFQYPGKPEQVRGHVWRGKLHSIARAFGPAQLCFRQAFALDPDDAAAREALAVLLMQDAPEEALGHLEILHRRDPENGRVTALLATVLRNLGQPDRAAELLDELVAADSTNLAHLLDRGRLALDQEQPQVAARMAQQALRCAPQHPQAHLLMSQYLRQVERHAEAAQFHQQFVELEAAEQRRRMVPPTP